MFSLPLKDYQERSLAAVESFVRELAEHDDPSKAWQSLFPKINYQPRLDGLNQQIPNICIKLPTGGGKTFLAACALSRINVDYFNRHTGLVLWITPTSAIYEQTVKSLKNKMHPYRHQLEIASGGNTIILERGDQFTDGDVENNLCVMVLMLQSFNISRGKQNKRRLFNDSGYASFFPDEADALANENLVKAIPNLVEPDLLERTAAQGININYSLGNVFKICRPIVIIDEQHKAKSQKAVENINQFNPRFILELSATPSKKFNLISSAGGAELKNAEMIKLPLIVDDVDDVESQDWKNTLNKACERLKTLASDAEKLDQEEQKYIRPIMLIAAEPKTKDDPYDQVEDVRQYLIDKNQILEEEIAIKISGQDELKGVDLFSRHCPIKYIITKEALKEGWDCSFAYVLAILSNKRGKDSLTQLVGRILRQPDATTTSKRSLNQSYVFCNVGGVANATRAIKEGLEKEGLDLTDRDFDADDNVSGVVKATLKRKQGFEGEIFIPQLNTVVDKNQLKPFDYYRDILSEIDWGEYNPSTISLPTLFGARGQSRIIEIDVNKEGWFPKKAKDEEIALSQSPNYVLMISQLTDKIPNAFEAKQILDKALEGMADKDISAHASKIVSYLNQDAQKWLLKKSEQIFTNKLQNGKIFLKLLASPYMALNYKIKQEIEILKGTNPTTLNLQKNLFEPQYMTSYNNFESDMASYIDGREAVKWWHRLSVSKTEWHVQGWKKDKIYPDFLAYRDGNKFTFIETKGDHLNYEYKEQVFETLNEHNTTPVGEFILIDDGGETRFELKLESVWNTGDKTIRGLDHS